MLKTNDPKVVQGWAMYDWANSVYSLVIKSSIFPLYFIAVTNHAYGEGNDASFFGFNIQGSVLYAWAISASFLVIALLSPLLSGIADYSGKKKRFMQFFTYLGGLSCISLAFFNGFNTEYGVIMAILASIGYTGGLVFYNSFLPDLVSADRYDSVSAKGFALGYWGSVTLMVVVVLLISFEKALGFSSSTQPLQVAFVLVGLWWMGFAQFSFSRLPNNVYNKQGQGSPLRKGFQELAGVARQLRQLPNLTTYLVAFFFFNTGVQTTMYLSATFGQEELHLGTNFLISTILVLNVLAAFGAYAFAALSKRRGNKYSLMVMLLLWIGVVVFAYFVVGQYQFLVLASVVGFIMGGIQSMSRSTYSKLIPQDTTDTTSFFSFYDVLEKVSTVLGTATFGAVLLITGTMRNSALSLGVFFILGILILRLVRIPFTKPTAQGSK